MKYLKSFNESVGISANEMDNINDICLDLIDLGLQYRIISSTMGGEFLTPRAIWTRHLFVDWNKQTSNHSESGIYNNMMIEIYDKYDISSGNGSESGDIKITQELIDIIDRINEYLDNEIKIGFYIVSQSSSLDMSNYIEFDINTFEESLERIVDDNKISQIDIRTENKRPY